MITGLKYTPGATDAQSLSAATSGTGAEVPLNDCRQFAASLTGAGTVTGGVVKLEASNVSGYSGTWHEVDSIDFSITALTNAKYQSTGPQGYGPFYRWRVSSSVTGGGSVTGEINGIRG